MPTEMNEGAIIYVQAIQICGSDIVAINDQLELYSGIRKLGIQGPPGLEFKIAGNPGAENVPTLKIGHTGIFTFDFGDFITYSIAGSEGEAQKYYMDLSMRICGEEEENHPNHNLLTSTGSEIIIDLFVSVSSTEKNNNGQENAGEEGGNTQ